jgi:hypothetical protein
LSVTSIRGYENTFDIHLNISITKCWECGGTKVPSYKMITYQPNAIATYNIDITKEAQKVAAAAAAALAIDT